MATQKEQIEIINAEISTLEKSLKAEDINIADVKQKLDECISKYGAGTGEAEACQIGQPPEGIVNWRALYTKGINDRNAVLVQIAKKKQDIIDINKSINQDPAVKNKRLITWGIVIVLILVGLGFVYKRYIQK